MLLLSESMKLAMKNMRKSVGQVIVCLRKNFKGLWAATFLLELLEGSCQESKITGTPAEAGDVSPLVHRSLEDQFVSLMVTEERAKFSADYQRLFVLIDHNKETV